MIIPCDGLALLKGVIWLLELSPPLRPNQIPRILCIVALFVIWVYKIRMCLQQRKGDLFGFSWLCR